MDNTGRRTILSLVILLFCVAENYANDCSLRVNRDLSDTPPLILPSNGGQEFIFPKLSDGTRLRLHHNEKYRLVCPGTNFTINNNIGIFNDTLAYCNRDDKFFIAATNSHDASSFEKISCQRPLKFSARRTVNNQCIIGTSYEVGYSHSTDGVQSEFFRVYDLCVNDIEANALYSHAKVLAVISEGQVSRFHQSFNLAGIYSGIPVNAAYNKDEQLKRLTTLLGDVKKAAEYIKAGEYYFAKGHLISNSDLFYIPHQRATFVYANALPMWQIVNNGNWKITEELVRGYATVRKTDLETWVGGYGVLQLDNKNGVKTDIYLHVDANGKKYIPVPKVLFKVVYNPTTRAGVVFLTANNPFLTTLPNDYVICTDVKSRITYRAWSKEEAKKGISYCCEIDDFRRVYYNLPQFVTSGLLL